MYFCLQTLGLFRGLGFLYRGLQGLLWVQGIYNIGASITRIGFGGVYYTRIIVTNHQNPILVITALTLLLLQTLGLSRGLGVSGLGLRVYRLAQQTSTAKAGALRVRGSPKD